MEVPPRPGRYADWALLIDRQWVAVAGLPCRFYPGKGRSPCGLPSVAGVRKRNGMWAYCSGHTYHYGRVVIGEREVWGWQRRTC